MAAGAGGRPRAWARCRRRQARAAKPTSAYSLLITLPDCSPHTRPSASRSTLAATFLTG